MEVIEQLIEPAEADLARLILDVAESEQVTDAQKTLQCSPLLSCLCPRWFLFLTRSVESPRRFLFLGRFLVWGHFFFWGQGFTNLWRMDAVTQVARSWAAAVPQSASLAPFIAILSPGLTGCNKFRILRMQVQQVGTPPLATPFHWTLRVHTALCWLFIGLGENPRLYCRLLLSYRTPSICTCKGITINL